MSTQEQIIRDRNDLTLWVLGKNQLTMKELQDLILRLDTNLQQVNL